MRDHAHGLVRFVAELQRLGMLKLSRIVWVIDALFDAGDRPQKWDIERLLILLAADGIGRRLTVSAAHGDRLVARVRGPQKLSKP